MGKSKKGGLLARQRAALARLEKSYEAFKTAGVDKAPWDTTRHGKPVHHQGRKFSEECSRFQKEIENLRNNINKHVKV